MTSRFPVDKKARELYEAGAVNLHPSGTHATVLSGTRHVVNNLDGHLRCSCDWQRHNPNREGCSHAKAVRLAMQAQAQEVAR